jgi:hypothetical protein
MRILELELLRKPLAYRLVIVRVQARRRCRLANARMGDFAASVFLSPPLPFFFVPCPSWPW